MDLSLSSDTGGTNLNFVLLASSRSRLSSSMADVAGDGDESSYTHPSPDLLIAWKRAIEKYQPFSKVACTTVAGRLGEIDPAMLKCDLLVSPANSFAIMDGGYVHFNGP